MVTGAVNGLVVVLPFTTAVAVPEATNWPFWTEMLLMVGTMLPMSLDRGLACELGAPIANAMVMDNKLAAVRPSQVRRFNELIIFFLLYVLFFIPGSTPPERVNMEPPSGCKH